MAYMDQANKARIAALVKKAMPPGWKFSLAVRHHSTLVLTVSEAPVDLLAKLHANAGQTHTEVNRRYFEFRHVDDDARLPLEAIMDALNDGNHDNSDLQADHHDVGWYVSVKVGRWDKPFRCTAREVAA